MRNLVIVWGAMCASIVLYGVVTFAVIEPQPAGFPAELLAAFAIGPAALSGLFGRVFATEVAPQTRWIVRWALAEAVGLSGLLVRMLGGAPVVSLALLGLGFVLVAVQFPREDG
jgi:hypothetical protein